jgi:hypothetical protein
MLVFVIDHTRTQYQPDAAPGFTCTHRLKL